MGLIDDESIIINEVIINVAFRAIWIFYDFFIILTFISRFPFVILLGIACFMILVSNFNAFIM